MYHFPTKSFHERQGYFRPLGLSPFRLLSLSKPFFPISQNSFSTRIFYSFPLVKLFSRFISSILSPPACKSSSYCSRKGGGHYVNPQILVKFSPPGLSLDIGTFCILDFAAFLKYKNFNTVMGNGVLTPPLQKRKDYHPVLKIFNILSQSSNFLLPLLRLETSKM